MKALCKKLIIILIIAIVLSTVGVIIYYLSINLNQKEIDASGSLSVNGKKGHSSEEVSIDVNNDVIPEDHDVSIIKAYYNCIAEKKLEEAYSMYSTPKVSFEVFKSWYENVDSIELTDFHRNSGGDYEFNVMLTENHMTQDYSVIVRVIQEKIYPISVVTNSGAQLIESSEEVAEEDLVGLFEVAMPVKILRTTIFSEKDKNDNSIGVLLEDYSGNKFAFCLDKRNLFDHYFFIGAEHPSKGNAQKISYGSKEEKQLLKILESWDYSDWQPISQFDNTKAIILMIIRELNHEFNTDRGYRGDSASAIIKIGEMNRIYQSKEFNFEFNFPENWFIFENELASTEPGNVILELWRPETFSMRGMDLAGGSPQKSMSITIDNLNDHGVSSLNDLIESLISEECCISAPKEDKIQVSGSDAYVLIDSSGHTFYYYLVFFEKDNYLYQIKFEIWPDNRVGDVRKEIISSFRFLE